MKTLPLVALCSVAVATGLWAWHATEQSRYGPAAPATLPEPTIARSAPGGGASHERDPASPDRDAESDCIVVRRYLPTPDGTTVAAIACEPDSAGDTHPYETYPDAALESLAHSDAEAAQILGMRLLEDDAAASLSLVIRASALAGGDPAPIRYYSHAYPHPVAVDGVPQRHTVRVKFVLAAVVALLDGGASAPNSWEPVIRAHSADPDREIALLQARARDIVNEMRRIQIDVSGTSTLGGPGDA